MFQLFCVTRIWVRTEIFGPFCGTLRATATSIHTLSVASPFSMVGKAFCPTIVSEFVWLGHFREKEKFEINLQLVAVSFGLSRFPAGLRALVWILAWWCDSQCFTGQPRVFGFMILIKTASIGSRKDSKSQNALLISYHARVDATTIWFPTPKGFARSTKLKEHILKSKIGLMQAPSFSSLCAPVWVHWWFVSGDLFSSSREESCFFRCTTEIGFYHPRQPTAIQ